MRTLVMSLFIVMMLPLVAWTDEIPDERQPLEATEVEHVSEEEQPVDTEAAEEDDEYYDYELYKDYEVYTLGEIVIAEEMPAVREIAISNEVTAEDIEATNSRTVAEALTYVPGVVVTAGRKNEPEISIHGLAQRKALILIDGVPYYETNYGKLNLDQIPADIVARIDVVKGAASVLYGPNAQAGVINIITKKGAGRPTFSVRGEAGDKHYYRGTLTHGNSIGIFNYWVSYVHREADAFPMSDDFDEVIGTVDFRPPPTLIEAVFENGGSRNNSDFDTDSVWLKFGVELDEDSEYYVNLSYIDTERGFPASIYENRVRPGFSFSQFGRIDRYDDFNVDLSGRQKISDLLTLSGTFFYHEHIDDYTSFDDWTYENELGVSRFKDYYVGGSAIAELRPVEWDTVSFAFHYKEDSHKQRDTADLPFDESKSHTGSVAVENEFNLIENLSVVLGISYDWFKLTDAEQDQVELDTAGTTDTVNPMVGAVYYFPDSTKLYGSVAKKTRFPTLDQLTSGDDENPPNWGLDAEESVNYTVGVSRPFGDIAIAELAFFYHDIDEWITRDFPGAGSAYSNYSEVAIGGIEFVAQLYPFEHLTLKFGYTFQDAEDKSSGRVTDRLAHVPEHKVDVGAMYEVPLTRTRVDITTTYVDEAYSLLPTISRPDLETQKSDEYFLLNARITQPFMKHFEAYVALNNILDKDYEPEYGFPAAGLNWWVGMTARF